MAHEVMERMMQRVKQKTAALREAPANQAATLEPVETIAEMYRDLETLDNDDLLFMAEDNPTCREILLRRILGLTAVSEVAERRD